MEPTYVRLTIPDSCDPTLVMGPQDSLLRLIEQSSDAVITVRGNVVNLEGTPEEVDRLTAIFTHLIELVEAGQLPDEADVNYAMSGDHATTTLPKVNASPLLVTATGKTIRPKTKGQQAYCAIAENHPIIFALGPAGTGKTYLAMAMAVAALRHHEIERLVLTRPMVEAGESLGYLPGTLEEKIDPYVRPLYDALFEMVGHETALRLIEEGIVEVSPLAFMRGRTFNDSFVILDEAQNTTPGQMKMFLTRLGFNSRLIITGDLSQRDVPGFGGIESAEHILKGIPEIAFVHLKTEDVVRHSFVAKIVAAYDRAEAKERVREA